MQRKSIHCTALIILSPPFLGQELSFGTSFAKVHRLGAVNGCCKQIDRHYTNLYIDICSSYMYVYIYFIYNSTDHLFYFK